MGVVLYQKDDDDNEHPISYFSRKLLDRETTVVHHRKGVLSYQTGGWSLSHLPAGTSIHNPNRLLLIGMA